MQRYLFILFAIVLALPATAQKQSYKDASFPGGIDSLVQYINRNVQVPAGPLTEKGAAVTVKFNVTPKGKITDLLTLPIDSTSAFTDELTRVVSGMPDWQPGYIDGVKSRVEYAITGRFRETADSGRHFLLEIPPRFPGGLAGLVDYLKHQVRYPKLAVSNRVGGTVKVAFDVEPDGYISNLAVISEPIGYDLEQEAFRVIEEMPRWQPGIQGDRKKKVAMRLPISFTLRPR